MGLRLRSKKASTTEGSQSHRESAGTSVDAPSTPADAPSSAMTGSSHERAARSRGARHENPRPVAKPRRARAHQLRHDHVQPDVWDQNSSTDSDAGDEANGTHQGHASYDAHFDISVPLSNADYMPDSTAREQSESASIHALATRFDRQVSVAERPADVSDALDAPSISLALHQASSSLVHASQGLSREHADLGDPCESHSLTLHIPGHSNRLNPTSSINHQHSWGRPNAESDVLEAPSLRLPHAEPPHQTCSMDAHFNAQFSFPANNEAEEATAVLADDSHMLALRREWDPASLAPVHAAAYSGDVTLLRRLLRSVSDLESLWTDGGTPLHYAVQGDRLECAEVLLQAGAYIDCVNGDGITPLMQAAVMGHEDMLILLLENGAEICMAFLPGSSEGLLHFCVEHEMVRGLRAVLDKPGGQLLATSTRLKPIYPALMSLAEACTSQTPDASPGATASAGGTNDITKARSVVDLLIEHSGLPANASYDDLIQVAEASYHAMETADLGGGSSCDTNDYLPSPEPASSREPESGRASSRHSGRRFVFTPTANLDCSPANCSPISVFGSERADSCTPSAMSRHCLGALGSAPALPSETSSQGVSSVVDDVATPRTPGTEGIPVPAALPHRLFPKKPLRVRTRIEE